jgi:hypothetical protein
MAETTPEQPASAEAAPPAAPGCPVTAERLAPQQRRYVDTAGPVAGRMMAAKGLVPLQGADFAHVLFMLNHDPDAKIRETAHATASASDERTKKVLLSALRDETLEAPVLDFFGDLVVGKDDLLECVVLNNATPDTTIARVVQGASARIAELASQNQLRLLRTPEILRALCGNAQASKATVDLACDFAVRSGVIMDDVEAMREARVRIHGPDLPPPPTDQVTADDVLREEKGALVDDEAAPLDEHKRMTLIQKVMKMTVAEKIKLATLGNKEARGLLLRETNKLVALAAIRSPRITDGEVFLQASSKTANEEILRFIYSSREFTKNYKIKLALVKNPKVPAAISLKFLSTVRDSEMRDLAKDKNIPTAVQQMARKIMQKKSAPVKVGND